MSLILIENISFAINANVSASNHFLIVKRTKKKTIANNTLNKTLAQQSPVYVCPPLPRISNDSCAEHNLCSPENIQTKQIEAFCGSFILWEAGGWSTLML